MAMNDCTRRTFMKTSLAAVSSVALASSAWSQIRGSNDDIRIAVVGVRKMGKEHIQDFRRLSGVRVVAICDADTQFLDIEVAKFKERNIKVDTYVDYRKLLENKNVDAVVLSVPDHLHALMMVCSFHIALLYRIQNMCDIGNTYSQEQMSAIPGPRQNVHLISSVTPVDCKKIKFVNIFNDRSDPLRCLL